MKIYHGTWYPGGGIRPTYTYLYSPDLNFVIEIEGSIDRRFFYDGKELERIKTHLKEEVKLEEIDMPDEEVHTLFKTGKEINKLNASLDDIITKILDLPNP